jgi:hypothetical protein
MCKYRKVLVFVKKKNQQQMYRDESYTFQPGYIAKPSRFESTNIRYQWFTVMTLLYIIIVWENNCFTLMITLISAKLKQFNLFLYFLFILWITYLFPWLHNSFLNEIIINTISIIYLLRKSLTMKLVIFIMCTIFQGKFRFLIVFICSYYFLCKRLVCSVLRHFQQYFSYIMAVSFIGGGNRRTRRKPPTYRKSLTNFIT